MYVVHSFIYYGTPLAAEDDLWVQGLLNSSVVSAIKNPGLDDPELVIS